MKATRIIVILLVVTIAALLGWRALSRFSIPREPSGEKAEQPPQKVDIIGIGAVLRLDEEAGMPAVVKVLPGSPAEQAGISNGLVVSKIDDTLTEGMPLNQCVKRVTGPAGTVVRLELIDPQKGSTNTLQVTRRKYTIEE